MKTIKQLSAVFLYVMGIITFLGFCRLSFVIHSDYPLEYFFMTGFVLLISIISIGFASLIKIPKDEK